MRLTWRLVPLFLCVLSSAALAQSGRLIEQRLEGADRLCIYDHRGLTRPQGREAPALKIGRGRVCPRFMPVEREEEEEPPIPSMASLTGENQINGQRLCVYSYLGRRYSRPAPVARSCPLTPNLVDWPAAEQVQREPE